MDGAVDDHMSWYEVGALFHSATNRPLEEIREFAAATLRHLHETGWIEFFVWHADEDRYEPIDAEDALRRLDDPGSWERPQASARGMIFATTAAELAFHGNVRGLQS